MNNEIKNEDQSEITYLGAATIYCSSTEGEISWSTYFGRNKDVEEGSIEIDSNGNLYISGYTGAKNAPILNDTLIYPREGDEGFIVSFTSDGLLRWSTYYGGSSSDRIVDMVVDSSGM